MIYYFFILFIILFFIYCLKKNKLERSFFKKYNHKSFLMKFLIPFTNFCIYVYDKTRFFDYNQYKDLDILQKNAAGIKQEFSQNYQRLTPTQASVFDEDFPYDPNYGYYFIKYYGDIVSNKQHFPRVFELVKSMPHLHTCFISIMSAKKKIPLHNGPYKGLLRFHLPLINNNPNESYLQVEEKKLYWKPYEPFLFDDTFKHKVNKKDEGWRIVLICDVERNLPYGLNYLNKFIVSEMTKSEYVTICRKKLSLE